MIHFLNTQEVKQKKKDTCKSKMLSSSCVCSTFYRIVYTSYENLLTFNITFFLDCEHEIYIIRYGICFKMLIETVLPWILNKFSKKFIPIENSTQAMINIQSRETIQ